MSASFHKVLRDLLDLLGASAMASFWTSSAPSATAFWNDAMAFL